MLVRSSNSPLDPSPMADYRGGVAARCDGVISVIFAGFRAGPAHCDGSLDRQEE
jgi:hypothetical protein